MKVDWGESRLAERRPQRTSLVREGAELPRSRLMSVHQSMLEELRSHSGVARKRHLRKYVMNILGGLVDETGPMDGDARFLDLSCDSLKAGELKQQLERALDLKLRSTLLFDHPTPNALCDHLCERLDGVVVSPLAADGPPLARGGDFTAEPI